METSGPSSQTPDHSRVHGETEDLDYEETDFHKSDREAGLLSHEQPKRDESSTSFSSSSLSSCSSSGAEHEEPDLLKDELQLYGGAPGEVVPSGESGLRRRGSDPASGEVEASELRRLNIKKDDWFMSLGVGLLTFASLETVGIYFGLVYRIHSILHGFIPLFQKLRLMGFRKTD
uniref:Transmembrane protein 40 isoform X2 n=2 Tax=Callorhinus ursinus TaxID=34884 RepID=A0A3Q7RLW4_CALUR|nr:transmembrane protein 40 isoform X2 [Callorhinus ursinus]